MDSRASWCSSHAVWHEYIAHAAHGLDVERQFWIFFDLAPEPCHLHVDRAFESYAQPRTEIGAGERPAGIGGKHLEERRFRTREANRLSLAAQFAAFGVEHRFAHLHLAMGRAGRHGTPAQERAAAKQELARL